MHARSRRRSRGSLCSHTHATRALTHVLTDAHGCLRVAQNYEINKKIKATSDEAEKKRLVEERKTLYGVAAAKSAEEKKAAGAAHKQLYSKAYGKYCVAANAASEVCTNELMKKMYGGPIVMGAKKAKKQ